MKVGLKGQAVVEYGLIIGSVLLLCLVGLTPLGKTLAAMFGNMVQHAPQAEVSQANTPASLPVPALPGQANANGSSMMVTPSAIIGADMPLPQNLAKLVETTGANGTTSVFSSQIKQIGEHLLATGEMTTAQANLFYQLANQGNEMANIEKLIEDAMKSGSNTVTYQGQTMTPYELSLKLGWLGINPTGAEIEQDPLSISPDARSKNLNAFLTTYQQLSNSGAMNNAQVSATVSSLSGKIVALSEFVEDNLGNSHTTLSLQDDLASRTTYWSSDQICSTGGGSTIGVTCQ